MPASIFYKIVAFAIKPSPKGALFFKIVVFAISAADSMLKFDGTLGDATAFITGVMNCVRDSEVSEWNETYQSIEDLHEALPDHSGDWYFTGDYPTPGGYRVVHKAFLNFYQNWKIQNTFFLENIDSI